MLRNEMELLRNLDHPNVIRAYESIESGGSLHLIMVSLYTANLTCLNDCVYCKLIQC
jgi:wyosine [tRNA(Phe)-imidazoG37] synthetase (radical SAM superfamily)